MLMTITFSLTRMKKGKPQGPSIQCFIQPNSQWLKEYLTLSSTFQKSRLWSKWMNRITTHGVTLALSSMLHMIISYKLTQIYSLIFRVRSRNQFYLIESQEVWCWLKLSQPMQPIQHGHPSLQCLASLPSPTPLGLPLPSLKEQLKLVLTVKKQ